MQIQRGCESIGALQCATVSSKMAGTQTIHAEAARRRSMKPTIITKETFRFFKELDRNNTKAWMDANRERYQQHVVAVLRSLLDAMTASVLALDRSFVVTGGTGVNFSRINRDIRFAKDKTPYNPRMYLFFPDSRDNEGSQLYVGINADGVTAGFRVYGDMRGKGSPLSNFGQKRALANPGWIAKQKKRLGAKYESYWHAMEKGEWTKHNGWPVAANEWKILRAWIVRRKFSAAAATRPTFPAEVARVFKDVAPLAKFASSPRWKA
jgi:hypothetical protein